ncbi:MAG: anti-sigma factor [Aliidongia sp.]
MIPDDPTERDALAGEYVLGVLDRASRAAMAAALEHDSDLRRRVEQWQDRLQPLADAVPPVTPPDDLWPRIEAGLPRPPHDVVTLPARTGLWGNANFWRFSTGGMTALAAGLAALMLLRSPAPAPGYVAVLTAPQALEASFLVESRPRAGLVLTSLTHASPAVGRAYELWALPPGAKQPVSLGLIPAGGRLALDSARIRPECRHRPADQSGAGNRLPDRPADRARGVPGTAGRAAVSAIT